MNADAMSASIAAAKNGIDRLIGFPLASVVICISPARPGGRLI
jgi:hypothetical protein